MTETRLDVDPEIFTAEWYTTRDRAAHLEQPIHAARFDAALSLVGRAVAQFGAASIVDLGCGDGGLLSRIRANHPDLPAWGYDLQPSNISAAVNERHVDARYLDWLAGPIEWGDLAVTTECLEHLDDPHAAVRHIADHARLIVVSSPASETIDCHDPVHAWVWDADGYRKLVEQAGYDIAEHRITPGEIAFQVILGVRR